MLESLLVMLDASDVAIIFKTSNKESPMAIKTMRGFTMPELFATLAVAAVLLSFAIPSMTAIIKRNRMAAAHNEFLSSLYLVRSEAAKRNRTMKMCRSPGGDVPTCSASSGGWQAGWTIWADVDGNDQIDAGEPVVQAHNGVRGDVRLTGNTSVANRIAFQASGATSGVSNGTFTVCVPGLSIKQQIIVSKPGRVRIAKLASDGSC